MIGPPLARAYEAPGHGLHWGMATFHPSLPRGARVRTSQNGTLREIITGPARENDGTFNLMGRCDLNGHLRLSGHRGGQPAELMVAPAPQTEGSRVAAHRDGGAGQGAVAPVAD